MDKFVNKKSETHFVEFKNSLKKWLDDKKVQVTTANGVNMTSDFLQYVFDHNGLVFSKEDFQKRKRVKNLVPTNDRCVAKRANGEQCTRHKKEDEHLCGTHVKGVPHGVITTPAVDEIKPLQKKEIWVQEIKGIVYHIDNENNVYKQEDIISNKPKPAIIAKWVLTEEGQYKIPDFGI